ncbi:hypothetical protein [Pannonibacter phragmitetus]|uniref:hypothetical protein n=1 Tax=Pannonibacter phragmitetus TaxID=121719 RepID=UPI000F44AE96|nr:hypothetical protein [Pannonibacter phragmitetus]
MYSEGKAGWPFGALGLDEPSSDAKVIKRAYARQLKQVDQASEADAFQALRQAYETALRQAETRGGIGTGTGTVEGHGGAVMSMTALCCSPLQAQILRGLRQILLSL